MTEGWRVHEGDCVDVMRSLEADSIDAVVCDPPYGLEFMGKEWDRLDVARANRGSQTSRQRPPGESGESAKFQLPAPAFDLSASAARKMQAWHERWAVEALRVLRPGGHVIAFGGTRTYHRLACALEDAGLEIRDGLTWLYGSGFPKSRDVARAVDGVLGVDTDAGERWTPTPHPVTGRWRTGTEEGIYGQAQPGERVLYDPATSDAERWRGWGTALKPGWEPIVLARKPLAGTVGRNVIDHGTGALNIDGCRVGMSQADRDRIDSAGGYMKPGWTGPPGVALSGSVDGSLNRTTAAASHAAGRWPANVVLAHHPDCVLVGSATVASNGHYPAERGSGGLGTAGHSGQTELVERATSGEQVERWACVSGCPVRALDEQTRDLAMAWSTPSDTGEYRASSWNLPKGPGYAPAQYGDSGGASRFFYCAKASTAERNTGLAGLPVVPTHRYGRGIGEGRDPDAPALDRNHHPTVKPVDLMRWLCRLVTPPGGVVLDPFLGSGTTGIAAALEGFRFVGIEREPSYAVIARRRIEWWNRHGADAIDVVRRAERADRDRQRIADAGQLDLFGDA